MSLQSQGLSVASPWTEPRFENLLEVFNLPPTPPPSSSLAQQASPRFLLIDGQITNGPWPV